MFLFGVVQLEGCFFLLLGAETLQGKNNIHDQGAFSLGEGLTCNSSLRALTIDVSVGNVLVWCGAVGGLFFSS
jgi:hypothetical protein